MIGAQIEEGRGKRTGRRVIATQPSVKIEASVEETATLLGVEGTNIITYTARIKSDGSLDGEGEGVLRRRAGSLPGKVSVWDVFARIAQSSIPALSASRLHPRSLPS
jgi:hypothetical protein